jgi:hypothetical protein
MSPHKVPAFACSVSDCFSLHCPNRSGHFFTFAHTACTLWMPSCLNWIVLKQRPETVFLNFLRTPGIDSASLCSLLGRCDNLIPTRFLAPIDCSKIVALGTAVPPPPPCVAILQYFFIYGPLSLILYSTVVLGCIPYSMTGTIGNTGYLTFSAFSLLMELMFIVII